MTNIFSKQSDLNPLLSLSFIKRIIAILRKIRAPIVRSVKPLSKYSLLPISSSYGFDRGEPIDRFYIENFLNVNKRHIKGTCLEVTSNKYTLKYGSNLIKSDILDIDKGNHQANVYGDLRNLSKEIKSDTYDCIVLTHVLGLIDDVHLAMSECYRILKPGGTILITSSCLGPTLGEEIYWRFTVNSLRFILEKHFTKSNINIKGFGNVLAGQAFWVGMAQEDMKLGDLEYSDPRYPVIVTAVAKK